MWFGRREWVGREGWQQHLAVPSRAIATVRRLSCWGTRKWYQDMSWVTLAILIGFVGDWKLARGTGRTGLVWVPAEAIVAAAAVSGWLPEKLWVCVWASLLGLEAAEEEEGGLDCADWSCWLIWACWFCKYCSCIAVLSIFWFMGVMVTPPPPPLPWGGLGAIGTGCLVGVLLCPWEPGEKSCLRAEEGEVTRSRVRRDERGDSAEGEITTVVWE